MRKKGYKGVSPGARELGRDGSRDDPVAQDEGRNHGLGPGATLAPERGIIIYILVVLLLTFISEEGECAEEGRGGGWLRARGGEWLAGRPGRRPCWASRAGREVGMEWAMEGTETAIMPWAWK